MTSRVLKKMFIRNFSEKDKVNKIPTVFTNPKPIPEANKSTIRCNFGNLKLFPPNPEVKNTDYRYLCGNYLGIPKATILIDTILHFAYPLGLEAYDILTGVRKGSEEQIVEIVNFMETDHDREYICVKLVETISCENVMKMGFDKPLVGMLLCLDKIRDLDVLTIGNYIKNTVQEMFLRDVIRRFKDHGERHAWNKWIVSLFFHDSDLARIDSPTEQVFATMEMKQRLNDINHGGNYEYSIGTPYRTDGIVLPLDIVPIPTWYKDKTFWVVNRFFCLQGNEVHGDSVKTRTYKSPIKAILKYLEKTFERNRLIHTGYVSKSMKSLRLYKLGGVHYIIEMYQEGMVKELLDKPISLYISNRFNQNDHFERHYREEMDHVIWNMSPINYSSALELLLKLGVKIILHTEFYAVISRQIKADETLAPQKNGNVAYIDVCAIDTKSEHFCSTNKTLSLIFDGIDYAKFMGEAANEECFGMHEGVVWWVDFGNYFMEAPFEKDMNSRGIFRINLPCEGVVSTTDDPLVCTVKDYYHPIISTCKVWDPDSRRENDCDIKDQKDLICIDAREVVSECKIMTPIVSVGLKRERINGQIQGDLKRNNQMRECHN